MEKTAGGGRTGAVVLALLAGSAYGVGGAISQIVKAQGYEIAHIVVAQFVAAIVILGTLVALRYRPTMSRREAFYLVILGAISTISSYAYYIAIDLLTVGQAVALQFQYVWMTVIIQSIAERKLPGKMVVISALLIIFGTVFGSGFADELIAGGVKMDPFGVFMALVCALFYAIMIFFNGKIAASHAPITRTFFMAVGGLIVSVVALPFMDAGSCDVVGLIPGGIVMALVMTIIPVACIAAATSKLPGGIVAILTSSELPMAVVAGCLLLGEVATPLTTFGIIVILVSIALSEMGNFGKPKKDAGELADAGDAGAAGAAEAAGAASELAGGTEADTTCTQDAK